MLNLVKIDGVSYDVLVTAIEETFEVVEGKIPPEHIADTSRIVLKRIVRSRCFFMSLLPF